MTTYKQYFNPEPQPRKPRERLIFWLALALVGIVIVLCVSCGTVNKNKNSFNRESDSAGVTKTEIAFLAQDDSLSNKSKESKTEEKKETTEVGGVKAVFGKHDSKAVTGPVIIKPDFTGGYTIDPGGRPIESVFLPKKRTTTETKNSESKSTDSTSVKNKKEKHRSDSTGVGVKKKEAGKSKVKEGINWGPIICVFSILVIIGIVVFVIRKAIKKVQ